MFRRFTVIFYIYFISVDISVCNQDFESLLQRIEELEQKFQRIEKLEQKFTKLELKFDASEQIVEEGQSILGDLELIINSTKQDISDHFESQQKTKREVESLKLKVTDLKEVTGLLGAEKSCQMLGKIGFRQSG